MNANQLIMSREKEFKVFQDAVKLLALYQASLDAMDDFKGTTLYKHDVKKLMNNLEKKIEFMIRKPLETVDADPKTSELFTALQERIEMINSLTTIELAQLKWTIEEHRKEEILNTK